MPIRIISLAQGFGLGADGLIEFFLGSQGKVVPGARARLLETFYRWSLRQTYSRCRTLPCISLRGNFSTLPTSLFLKESLSVAIANIGSLPDFVRQIEGMSGQKYRTLINHFVKSHLDARYLEIGSWQGSTAAAALYGNSVKALCIDNWSQFGGPKSTFLTNLDRVRSQSLLWISALWKVISDTSTTRHSDVSNFSF